MKKFVYLIAAMAFLSAVAVFAAEPGLRGWSGNYSCARAASTKEVELDFEGKLAYLKITLGNDNTVEGAPVVSFNVADASYTAKLNFQVVRFSADNQVSVFEGTGYIPCSKK